MKEIKVEIKNEAGLHARPSSKFVELVSEYDSEIIVKTNGEEVNGRSIMGLMLLAAEKGRVLMITADGEDEKEVLEALRILIEEEKFNET